jgi:hypothetical protein
MILLSKLTKKKILDMVAYSTLLLHNNELGGVISNSEIDVMMKTLKTEFNDNEQEVIYYLKQKVKSYKKDLDEHLKTLEESK